MDSHGKMFKNKSSSGRAVPSLTNAYKQYQYSTDRQEFLDMVTCEAHVGHCHPHVVSSGQEQMKLMSAGQGFYSVPLQDFSKTLKNLLPSTLQCIYMLNSGSEANDLALGMARAYTGGDDFIVFSKSYHGSLSNVFAVSPKALELVGDPLPAHTHTVSAPDLYRGPYTDAATACDAYVAEVSAAITSIEQRGGKLAAFLSEPISVACGVIVPPQDYYTRVYDLVHKAGGVVIADETGCGIGRAGDHFWTFEHFEVVPDIVTVGKSLGNGFPLALAVTTKDIANNFGDVLSTFGGNPVACRIASAVLEVMHGEMMRASARSVGKYLLEELRALQKEFSVMGEVRGRGLCVAVELVSNANTRAPHPAMAQHVENRLVEKGCLVSVGGSCSNVLVLTPPLCVTQDNVRQFIDALEDILRHSDVPVREPSEVELKLEQQSPPISSKHSSHQPPAAKRRKPSSNSSAVSRSALHAAGSLLHQQMSQGAASHHREKHGSPSPSRDQHKQQRSAHKKDADDRHKKKLKPSK